jgi:acetyltransferase-like isoleucine patch superfamily enzyme
MNVGMHLENVKQAKGSSYSYENAFIELEADGEILLDKNVQFLFNCSWLKKDPFPSVLVVRSGGKLVITGNVKIFSGAEIYVNKNAILKLGNGYINGHLTLHCFGQIEIGEDVAIADNVTIRDSDNHNIISNPDYVMTQPIHIGNHVWVGTNVTILKGVTIGDGAIIAAGSVVTRNVPPRCLAAGIPARIVKQDVEWE